jgi:hypothetical protein
MRPIPFAVLLVLLPGAILSAEADKVPKYDWKNIPPSKLGEAVEAAAKKLGPQVKDKKCLLTPVQTQAVGKYLAWDLEGHVQRLLLEQLTKEGAQFVDDGEFRKKLEAASTGPRGRVETVAFTQQVIKGAADLTKAEVVIVGVAQLSAGGGRFMFTAYDNAGSKRLGSADFTLNANDITPAANTPPANRKMITWIEQQMGKKIDRGECTDVATAALKEVGATLPGGYVWGKELPAGTTPLPGDVIQLENAQIGNRTTAHHTVVVWEVLGPRNVRILHQNWAGGKEEGRKVGPGVYDFTKLKDGEVHMFRPIAPAGK